MPIPPEPLFTELQNHWEAVSAAKFHSTLRLKVPGGWLYYHKAASEQPAMVFVPEPKED